MVIVTTSYPQKDFIFKALSNLLDLCLPDKSLYFWQVIESIHKFIIEIHALQCLFVRSSIKKHRRGRIISSFTKGETFDLLWQPSALGGDLTMCPVFLYSPRKALLSPSLWPRKEHTWTLNWKGSLLICFENGVGVPYSIRQSRNSMMNSFITVNITPTCKRQFRGYIYPCPLQKDLPPISLAWSRIYWETNLKEELTDLFWKLLRVWYFLFPNPERWWWTLCLYVRDNLESNSLWFTYFYLM